MKTVERVSTEIPIEKLRPPGIRGQLHVLVIRPEEQRTDAEFIVYGLLSKFPASSTNISGSFYEIDGSSYLLASPRAAKQPWSKEAPRKARF